jgi:hypothetical protein
MSAAQRLDVAGIPLLPKQGMRQGLPPDGNRGQLDLVVRADHNQFYVCNEGPWGGVDHLASDDDMLWVGAAAENHLDVRPGTIAVLTKTEGYVRVGIAVSAQQPQDDAGSHDHVVEASLESRSGNLVIIEETAEVGRLTVAPAVYRTRISWDGLDFAPEINLDREKPAESVRIQLWPGDAIDPQVRKWYWEWKPKPPERRPKNPYGLRVLVGESEIERRLAGRRVVGYQPQADGSRTALIRDGYGKYWERVYSEEPPYEPIMFEIPSSEIDRFERF